jgi:ubiquinone/menaquinone biosynthesis C-methylase UbiE
MLNRRILFSSIAGAVSAVSVALSKTAQAKTSIGDTPIDIQPRSKIGQLERLPTLDAESRNDFLTGVRNWRGGTVLTAARNRFNEILEEAGEDPRKDLPLERIFELIGDDPLVSLEGRVRIDAQRLAHRTFRDSFQDHRGESYLAELQEYDKRGPGTLELNPDMYVPDYTRHEIHMQPGGYVGGAFAGAIYHYGTNAFYEARGTGNYLDEHHTKLASQVSAPADGRVNRILDMGCGIGQLTVGLKKQHPDAEVWGVDVGAPMIRYGHMRAVDENVDVNFAQRLAEDTRFPDNHFDIVASYILHHEVPAEASRQIIAEAFRVLRPGGVYVPIDFHTGGQSRRPPNAFNSYQLWKDHRWNNEVWRIEYQDMDYFGHMEKVGFQVNRKGPRVWFNRTNVLATKPA